MRDIARSTVIAAAAVGLMLSAAAALGDNAFAQAKQSPTASEASAPAERPIKQIAITEKQIEGVLAAR